MYKKYVKETRILLTLAIPVILTQISQTSMGMVDIVMSGTISIIDMAAVAIGTSIWLPAILLGHGLLLTLTPIIAQLNGSGRKSHIPYQICQGFWLALIISLIIMLLLYNSNLIINYMDHIEPVLAKKTIIFLRYLLWGVPGYLFFQVLRCQCEGLLKTKPGMIISFIGLLSNIPINYILIYGKFGIPALGGIGCGIATALVYWIMFITLYKYIHQADIFKNLNSIKILKKPNITELKRLFKLGLPISMALFFEVTLFTLVTLLIAPFGMTAIAGHQIALNFSSLIFVLPLSIGVAATIRIGFRLGEGNVEQAYISAWTSLVIGVILACCTATLTYLLRNQIASLYNDKPAVIAISTHLMLLAAIYQISDSIQVISNGILRGYKDNCSIFIITFIAYWLLGLPCGCILALTHIICPPMGPCGFWVGFIIGLSFAAILMLFRICWLQKQNPEKILYRATR